MKKLIISIGILFGFSQCVRENPEKYPDNKEQLTLQNIVFNGQNKLIWTKKNSAAFKEYLVLVSNNPIPAEPSLSNLGSSLIYARFDNIDSLSLIAPVSIVDRYVRIAINIGPVLVYSNELLIPPSLINLDNNNSIHQVLVDEKNKSIFVIFSSGILKKIDMGIKKIVKVISYKPFSNSDITGTLLYDKQGNTVLYLPYDNKILVYSGDLTLLKSIQNTYNVLNLVAIGNRYLYFTDISSQLPNLNQVNLANDVMTRIGEVGNAFRMLKMNKNGTVALLGTNIDLLGKTSLKIYNLNENGDFLSKKNMPVANYSWKAIENIDLDGDGKLIISNAGGVLLDTFSTTLRHINSSVMFSSVYFNKENAYASICDAQSKKVNKINTAVPYQNIEEYTSQLNSVTKHFEYLDKIYFIGNYFDKIDAVTYQVVEEANKF